MGSPPGTAHGRAHRQAHGPALGRLKGWPWDGPWAGLGPALSGQTLCPCCYGGKPLIFGDTPCRVFSFVRGTQQKSTENVDPDTGRFDAK